MPLYSRFSSLKKNFFCCTIRFGGTIDSRRISSSIQCLPEACRVASMNVTAILAIRGNSYVEAQDYLNSLDNKFRLYHIQMHAGVA